MQHPKARIVGHERDLDPLTRDDEHSVAPGPAGLLAAVASEHAEGVTVQVDRVREGGPVEDREAVAAAEPQAQERRLVAVPVLGHGPAVDGPERTSGEERPTPRGSGGGRREAGSGPRSVGPGTVPS